MKNIYLVGLLMMCASVCASEVSVGRYTITETAASKAQRFPLAQVKKITVPQTVLTNRQAVEYLLVSTGYSQASDVVRSQEDNALMRKPLALSNREFVNLTILEMLSIIAGLGYAPIVDPINRLVAFEAIYEFKQ